MVRDGSREGNVPVAASVAVASEASKASLHISMLMVREEDRPVSACGKSTRVEKLWREWKSCGKTVNF